MPLRESRHSSTRWRWPERSWTRRASGSAFVLACLSFMATLAMPRSAAAQNGGLFLLVPFGARAVGQGDAVVADTTLGTEAMWWNAAALAWLPKREIAIHHSQTVIANSDMLTFAVPSRVLGTLDRF